MPFELDRVAQEKDNAVGLEAWREIDPPLFKRYRYPSKTEWYESEGRRMNSLGLPKDYGAPLVIVVFDVLSVAEFQLLKTYEGDSTIHAYDKANDQFGTFSADMFIERLTPDNWRNGRWYDIRAHFIHLEDV